jgi:hypothetical protein
LQHPPLTLTATARQRWIGYDRLVLADAGRQRIGVDKDAGFEQLRMFQCPVALGRQLEKMLPNVKFHNVKFHYVANAGHQVQNDQPQLVAKLMMDFLAA